VPQANVELIRGFLAWLPNVVVRPDDDQALIDRAFRDYLDQGFEVRLAADYPEGSAVFNGRDGLSRYAAWVRDSWSEFRIEPERFIDADDRVVVFTHIVGKGRASGVPVELHTANVFTVHDGRITSIRAYQDRSEALKAAGLQE
jgi:ketosteroid isomerase-like protein